MTPALNGRIMKIDLHGRKHADARNDLIRQIEKLWNSDSELTIVTGHSPRMKEIVIGVLDEYKLDYQMGDFSQMNMGFIKTTV